MTARTSKAPAFPNHRPDAIRKGVFVYFARAQKSGLIKIGFSGDPTNRLKALQSANGDTLSIILTVPGGSDKEMYFHDRFWDSHARGEWFREEGKLQAFLEMKSLSVISKKPVEPPAPKSRSLPAIGSTNFSKMAWRPRTYGYARVSTAEQSLDMQVTALEEAGCDRIITDKLSGKTAQRHGFKLMLKLLHPGDSIVVYSLSRLFRNAKQLLELFDLFKAKKITLRSLTEKSIDINTSHGRMIATVLAAVDENEVGRVRDRTVAGMAERGRQGVRFGAPPKVSPEDAKKMAHMRFKTGIRVPAIAAKFYVSAAAVYQHTKPYAAKYS